MALKLSSLLSVLQSPGQDRRLSAGFAVSIVMHVMVLLIPLAPAIRPLIQMPNLDVILVNARTDTAPKNAQALAQANLEGGGDSSEKVRATSPLMPRESLLEGNDFVDMVRGQPAAPDLPQHQQVLTQQGSTVAIDRSEAPEDKPSKSKPTTGPDAQDATAAQLKLRAEIAERMRNYNERPRVKYIGASTQEYRFAQYIESWRAKAERIGEQNYPAAARGKIYGSLMMSVTIAKDGTVKDIVIKRHSKHKVLDEAAVMIVMKGEPYSEFPKNIAEDYDAIEITRTWTFTNDKLGVTAR